MLLDYIKGHMGGNTIAFLLGDQVPQEKEIQAAHQILSPVYLACHEAGLLYPPRDKGDLMVKIVEPGNPRYIIACGGLTQVLGKSLVETFLGGYFGIEVREPLTQVHLETDAGLLKLKIEVEDGKALRVISDLTLFGWDCYREGVQPMDLGGVEALRVGKFLVVDGENLSRRYPGLDYASLGEETGNVLVSLQEDFRMKTGLASYDYALYDLKPGRGGDLRAVFPHNIRAGWIEPACGTGTVAIGIALAERGQIPPQNGTLVLETGGEEDLGGPDRTFLDLRYQGGRLTGAFLSHSFVQVTAIGQVIVD